MVDLHGLAEKLKIDDMAVCGAEKFSEVEAILKKDMKLGILPPFTDLDIRKRVCPEETLAGAAGFIVILEHYTPETYKKRTGPVSYTHLGGFLWTSLIFIKIFRPEPAGRFISASSARCGQESQPLLNGLWI